MSDDTKKKAPVTEAGSRQQNVTRSIPMYIYKVVGDNLHPTEFEVGEAYMPVAMRPTRTLVQESLFRLEA